MKEKTKKKEIEVGKDFKKEIEDKFINNFIFGKLMSYRGVNKKGQVTIFVVIAIVIVAALIIFFAVTDVGRQTIQSFVDTGDFDVRGSIESCIEENEDFQTSVTNILEQGGGLEPEFSYLFEDVEVSYLCYTNEYYDTCVNQEPLLLSKVESEILKVVSPIVDSCIQNANEDLKSRGYKITPGTHSVSVDTIPSNIIIQIDYPLTISKGDNVRKFSGFQVRKESEAYHLVTLATSIINFEARYGESDPNTYMALYPQTKVEKLKQGDGTTIYKVSNRETEESFNFAVRSLVFPPGYFAE
jgi:hypothetical protein